MTDGSWGRDRRAVRHRGLHLQICKPLGVSSFPEFEPTQILRRDRAYGLIIGGWDRRTGSRLPTGFGMASISVAKSGGLKADDRFGSMLGGKRRGAFHSIHSTKWQGCLSVELPASAHGGARRWFRSDRPTDGRASRGRSGWQQYWDARHPVAARHGAEGATRFFMTAGRGAFGRSPVFLPRLRIFHKRVRGGRRATARVLGAGSRGMCKLLGLLWIGP